LPPQVFAAITALRESVTLQALILHIREP